MLWVYIVSEGCRTNVWRTPCVPRPAYSRVVKMCRKAMFLYNEVGSSVLRAPVFHRRLQVCQVEGSGAINVCCNTIVPRGTIGVLGTSSFTTIVPRGTIAEYSQSPQTVTHPQSVSSGTPR